MLAYGFAPTLNILWMPLLFLLAVVTSLGVGVWLAAVNVQYRDIRYIVPFLMQIWMFATPIVYPSSLLPEPWATLYGLNPMAGVVEGFRWALLGQRETGRDRAGIRTGGGSPAGEWLVLLPEDGEELLRRGMSRAATAMRAERLSKCYTIGKSRAPYQTFGETLAEGLKAPLQRLRQASRRIRMTDGRTTHLGAERCLLRDPARRRGWASSAGTGRARARC